MVRALAVLTCGAFLTLVIGVVGAGKPVLTVVLGGLCTVLATVGFAWVQRRDQRACSVAYVAAVLALAGGPTSSCATAPCRPSGWPRRRSATGWPATSTTGWDTR